MHVSFNLQILPAEKTFLAAVSSAALYGKGVFTSLAVYDSKPFLWEKHWRRLTENSARLGIDLGDFEAEPVKRALLRLISQNGLKIGRARLTFFDEAAGKIWDFGLKNKTSLLITTSEFQKTNDEFLLTVSPFPVNSKSPLANLKSCNYLESLLALEEARKRGFDESVRLNETGQVVSVATANIFWLKGGNIFTPALETGCLAGTTREFLTENFPVQETKSAIEELSEADEIFLTSAGIGIRAAHFENIEKKISSVFEKVSKFFERQKSAA
jgi:branched-chain amino acid aminotransferase